MIFEGAISVKAVIQGKHRTIEGVFMDEDKAGKNRDFRFIAELCQQEKIKLNLADKQTIAQSCSSRQHGGIYCEATEYQTLDPQPLFGLMQAFLAFLEGIEDPFNFGYALRSLYAAGCDGVICPQRNWGSAEAVITRSSAGASEFLPLYQSERPDEILRELQYNGVDILCSARKEASSVYQYDFRSPFVICFGGEKRGLSAEIMKLCQQNLYIPYQSDFRKALNSSSAVSVVAFEVYRQRHS